jgi:hypothetical protein
MSGVLDRIAETLAAEDLTLAKAHPRGSEHLILEIVAGKDHPVAGQWFGDPDRAAAVAALIETTTGGSVPVPVLGRCVVVQRDGVDRRLAGLHRLVVAPGAALVTHRAERRGVVRRVEHDRRATYTKAVRPSRTASTVARARVSVDGVVVPRVTASDARLGTVTCAEVPGVQLHDLLAAGPAVSLRQLCSVGRAVGEALARLHGTTPPSDVDAHDAAAELQVTQAWLDHATTYGLLDSGLPVRAHLDRLYGFAAEPGSGSALVHRDMHDKQILIGEEDAVGMLDFDLAAIGEPALDLANLLVHLELRVIQRHCSQEAARACAEGLVDGYRPGPDVWQRVPGYALATQLRLAAVYAFRPGSAGIGPSLLARGTPGPLSHEEVFA